MKIQALYDLQQDINRLFIAGSKFAKNDPRLQKQIPLFNKMGEKAPVFKKLASELEALTQSGAVESSVRLMGISTLLYSVLYTQGEMQEEDLQPLEQIPLFSTSEISSDYSYMQLKPVIQALSESNSGRLEVLKDAYKQGIFKDYRTYPYLDRALGDKYSELADYVEEIIKETKEPIIPFLIKNFSYEGRAADIRRLRLLSHFDYSRLQEMLKTIMEGDSVNLQAEAIQILAGDVANESWIMELAKSKNKVIRQAAYEGLAKLNTETSLVKLKDLFLTCKNKTDREALAKAISKVSDYHTGFPEILDRVKETYQQVLVLDKVDNQDDKVWNTLERFITEVIVLEKKDVPGTYEFLEEILASPKLRTILALNQGRYTSFVWNLYSRLGFIYSLPASKVLPVFEKVASNIQRTKASSGDFSRGAFEYYLKIAVQAGYSAERIYDVFSPLYHLNLIGTDHLEKYCGATEDQPSRIDIRWLDLVYLQSNRETTKANAYVLRDSLEFVHQYEPYDSKRFAEYLTNILKNAKQYRGYDRYPVLYLAIQALMDRKIEGRFDLICSALSTGLYSSLYVSLSEADFWKEFPKEYAAKVREINKKYNMNGLEAIAYAIELANN